ncbi:hotdog domain-containing protein [Microbacterium ulmi]|uniref:3-aminobutyryl-CoA ammonia-lyase n=1 Tax=Microbacterium ulmi TaxID=179095 RepID=A0A7Y2M178_9MICO|nr:hotdog domain-containing protein [Microbacterium ulmi]NII68941.1 3-aminobutyryl-CoA ammonia-lyase [Microbacterium ulmi]NNH03924.1 3-aminobutyryl-CoA ammonia-lyase [Microbacterium ulmi]
MTTVTHRRYVPFSEAHYAGGLVDGAFVLRLFGEVATEISILTAHDEGLLAGYESVDFHAPVRAGDVIEAVGEIASVGRRSRRVLLTARVTARSAGDGSSRAEPLAEPVHVATATAVLVVPAEDVPTEVVPTGLVDVGSVR